MRKLGMPTDQRMAMIKNQATYLLWYGKIETTLAAAKEVSRYAEKLLTTAINNYEDINEITKTRYTLNKKKERVATEQIVANDGPKKLAARRKLMRGLYDIPEPKLESETMAQYKVRTKEIKHPLIEKMFNELAPKYKERAKQVKSGGGYTRIIKLGERKGDAAEMALIELV